MYALYAEKCFGAFKGINTDLVANVVAVKFHSVDFHLSFCFVLVLNCAFIQYSST